MIWRVAISPRFKENFEQASSMPLDDLLAALDLLDVLEEAEAEHARKVRASMKP